MKKILFLFLFVLLSGCSSLKVTKPDPITGYFPAQAEATVVKNEPINLDERKDLILVANSEFEKGQIENIGYFNEIITFDDLERIIIQNNLSDKVPSLRDKIGINNAAKHYKPFLWFRFDVRGTGTQQYAQFILTDPLTLEDYFITETHMDRIWRGVNDQYNWYPMFNALIDYIKTNSQSYN